jgi:hypothetical protein
MKKVVKKATAKIPKGKKKKEAVKKEPKKSKEVQSSEKKKPVCKRGYKICKGPDCVEMMNIHKKSCPKCGFINKMKKPKNSHSQIKTLLTKEIDLKKKKFVTKRQLGEIKKYLENSIFSVKSNFVNKF